MFPKKFGRWRHIPRPAGTTQANLFASNAATSGPGYDISGAWKSQGSAELGLILDSLIT
jgi:hypothetical protein